MSLCQKHRDAGYFPSANDIGSPRCRFCDKEWGEKDLSHQVVGERDTARREAATLRERVKALEGEQKEWKLENAAFIETAGQASKRAIDAEAKLATAEAQAAAMRAAIQQVLEQTGDWWMAAKNALASDAGAAILARLEAAEKVCAWAEDVESGKKAWLGVREALAAWRALSAKEDK